MLLKSKNRHSVENYSPYALKLAQYALAPERLAELLDLLRGFVAQIASPPPVD